MWIYDVLIIILIINKVGWVVDNRYVTKVICSKQLSSGYFIVWTYDNVCVWDKGCDSVVV